MKRLSAVVAVCVLSLGCSFAQPPVPPPAAAAPAPEQAAAMTNQDVIDMAGLGLSDGVLIDKINAAPSTSFDTSLPALKALKAAKISDPVIRAMINPQGAGTVGAAAPPPPPSSAVNEAVAAAATAAAAPPPPPQPDAAAAAAASAASAPPAPPFHSTDGYVRMYVTDHPIDETIGMVQASANRHGAAEAGVSKHEAGDDPRTVEIQADVQKDCSAYIRISSTPERADYILVFRRQGGKRSSYFAMGGLAGLAISAGSKVDGASLFENTGDMIYATKQTSVEKSIKDICVHVPPPVPQVAAVLPSAPPPPPPSPAK